MKYFILLLFSISCYADDNDENYRNQVFVHLDGIKDLISKNIDVLPLEDQNALWCHLYQIKLILYFYPLKDKDLNVK